MLASAILAQGQQQNPAAIPTCWFSSEATVWIGPKHIYIYYILYIHPHTYTYTRRRTLRARMWDVHQEIHTVPCADMSMLTVSMTSRKSSFFLYLMPSLRHVVAPVTCMDSCCGATALA